MSSTEEQAFWASDPTDEQVLTRFEPWIVKEVKSYARDWYDDDILQEARIAVLKSIPRYDKSTRFMTFVRLRIRGSIQDYLRNTDKAKRNQRMAERKRKSLEKEGLDPTLYMSEKAYKESQIPAHYQLDEKLAKLQSPKLEIEIRDIARCCNLEEQTILYLYYVKEKTMREIGQFLGISESRISQNKLSLESRHLASDQYSFTSPERPIQHQDNNDARPSKPQHPP